MRFHATIELGGKTATGIEVPPDVVAALGSHKRPPVRVTINGHSYQSTVATMGGRFMIPLSAEHRTAAGVTAGDRVEIDLELDTVAREVAIPLDFAAALDADPTARSRFDRLSNSQKKWHVLSIDGAKTSATRERRIEKSIALLRAAD
jgi:hypothetical protein